MPQNAQSTGSSQPLVNPPASPGLTGDGFSPTYRHGRTKTVLQVFGLILFSEFFDISVLLCLHPLALICFLSVSVEIGVIMVTKMCLLAPERTTHHGNGARDSLYLYLFLFLL
ncbi:hypothetical protein J3458_000641 [Metarhizium acridum]|uniref:uncharacterized protein n=1 Tax=Metarhizium acridum TaxID=92637 RepID=UPI001C6D22DA|nr:hypothetical protein J3458_000641 [Metarhizium acridum]